MRRGAMVGRRSNGTAKFVELDQRLFQPELLGHGFHGAPWTLACTREVRGAGAQGCRPERPRGVAGVHQSCVERAQHQAGTGEQERVSGHRA